MAEKGGAAIGQKIAPAVERYVENSIAKNNGAPQWMQDMTRGTLSPATVWHGSPHKFDKFDFSKIGTGEGAQAYGHGLYLADSAEVAGGYKAALNYKNNSSLVQHGPNDYSVIAKDGSEIGRGYLGKASRLKSEFDAAQTGSLYKVDLVLLGFIGVGHRGGIRGRYVQGRTGIDPRTG